MQRLQLGLTKTYNLFHTPDMDAAQVAKAAKVTLNEEDAQQALRQIEHLRALHVEMDEAVKAAYGWDDVVLSHGFHEVDFLPENDRVRYTISPEARKTILRRLLLLNHERYAEEQAKKKEEKVPAAVPVPEPETAPLTLIVDKRSEPVANVYFRRGILAAELVTQQHADAKFGSVKLQKQIQFCQELTGEDLEIHTYRHAAGPYDPRMMHSIRSQLKQLGFRVSQQTGRGRSRWRYHPTKKSDRYQKHYKNHWQRHHPHIQRVIDLTRPLSMHEISIVATLYDAWKYLLNAGQAPSDDEIVIEATENWHEEKKQIPNKDWHWGLGWLRENNLAPHKTNL